ncbi:MAG: hypothetical protein NZ959_08660 [Armatimonadetes bacterium]|nr:hypothetical protein [Armatimonadota bacterium]MDW8122541.1 hypothetical protein [Armatimonadota bacterium]
MVKESKGSERRGKGHEPSDAEKAQDLLERASRFIVDKGMEVPAILFLEAHKPLANLIGHAFWLTMPFWAFFWGVGTANELGRLFSSPEMIEKLIQRIEDISDQKMKEKGKARIK